MNFQNLLNEMFLIIQPMFGNLEIQFILRQFPNRFNVAQLWLPLSYRNDPLF